MTNTTYENFVFLQGLGPVAVHRILFVSIAINFCVALRLLISSFVLAIKTCKKEPFKKPQEDKIQLRKEIASLFADEAINLLLSILALVCVCRYPVRDYNDGQLPALLEILICCNSGRYFYRIGVYISWDGVKTEKKHFHEFVHHFMALLFYLSILITNENWWVGVIGNFLEMESLITTTHYILKLKYPSYHTIETWCFWIQIASGFSVRIVLPSVLCILFLPAMGNLHTNVASVSLYIAMVFFSLYNVYLLTARCRKLHLKQMAQLKENQSILTQTIAKQPVPCVEVNIFPEKGKDLLLQQQDSSILPEKQLTWSMVGLEEISTSDRTKSAKPKTLSRDAKKSVRFVENPSYYGPEQVRVKPTLNVNTDTTGGTKSDSKGYSKNLIFKPTTP